MYRLASLAARGVRNDLSLSGGYRLRLSCISTASIRRLDGPRREGVHFFSSFTRTASDAESDNNSTLISNVKVESSFYTPVQKEVMERCKALHSSIMPLNDKFRGPLAPQSDRGTALPFVLLVGNHSSGKSSFINYVLGRNVQTAGVAPTDDSFTIIAPGPDDKDQDGPALVGDPDLGFSPLRQFGPTLVHHTALKIRTNINSNFIMVDSPGMIDSPSSMTGMMMYHQQPGAATGAGGGSNVVMDRGYDFTGVVKWFAERADIVCLFFDPDKPGTTGETLSILLHALTGMDHKLLIVLNKADQFEKIHDFARAYGSLCWNLSKVIPRKDLPRIYTMCLPVSDMKQQTAYNSGLHDLHTARDEVVAEVRRAPDRRVDNMLTHLYDAVCQLQLHLKILQDLQHRWSRFYWQCKWQEVGVVTTGFGLTGLLVSLYHNTGTAGGAILSSGMEPVAGAVVATTVLVAGGLTWYHQIQLREWEQQACSSAELSAAFQRTHAREIGEGDEYVAALWQRVRDPLRAALQQLPIGQQPTVKAADLANLQRILESEVPSLRRLISPAHYGKEN